MDGDRRRTSTRGELREAYESGLAGGLRATNPYPSGVLAAAWRSGYGEWLAERHAGLNARMQAAARKEVTDDARRVAAAALPGDDVPDYGWVSDDWRVVIFPLRFSLRAVVRDGVVTTTNVVTLFAELDLMTMFGDWPPESDEPQPLM
ncbi:ribosome modulation factor [Gordonia liuliyuniae]|uniref:Uncharacterized protein n=1 Tax=Gordonia liuliyuniae TaxID=2911517 RepID=A0ABS9IT55_9ACTN|nr:hypothetical protein [Gordonia liuliyuniae]MCF8588743.1 hypothetical protein [Gordonia liuliyuniae]